MCSINQESNITHRFQNKLQESVLKSNSTLSQISTGDQETRCFSIVQGESIDDSYNPKFLPKESLKILSNPSFYPPPPLPSDTQKTS